MSKKSVVFIDARIANYQAIVAALPTGTAWHLLNQKLNGINQIQSIVANYSDLDSIQIFSHGSAGSIQIGSDELSSQNIASYQNQLAAIGSRLSSSGDILLYGCNVAQGTAGQAFVKTLAQYTGADVAASTNLTGSTLLGGDWALETNIGNIDVKPLSVSQLQLVLADTTAPTVNSFSPSDNSTGVALDSNIVVTFSEAIKRGTSTIYLRAGSATGTVIESFTASNSNRLSISDTTLTIDPTSDLANNTHYYLTFASGTIKDLAGNSYAGISNYDFTTAPDTTAPTITTFSPSDGTTGVALGSNIVLTFNEAIQRGTGTIYLRSDSATGTVIESFNAANSNRLSISGTKLTIDPTNNLANNTHYYLTFASGTIKDVAGNSYAGTSSYDFTTEPDTTAPTVSSFTPRDGATGIAVDNNIVLTFNEAIQRGTGTIYLRSGSATGTVIESFDAASSNRLSISGTTLTIDPSSDLANNTHYYVTFAAATITDLAGNNYAGTNSYDFTTVPDTIAPIVTSFSPNDGASSAALDSNVILTFSEAIQRGSGTIYLRTGSATGTVIESYLVTNSANLSINGATLTINPTNNLANNTHYYVTFASSAIKDLVGNSYAGTTSYDFFTPDTIAPTVTGFSPSDGTTGVAASSNIVVTFSEAIQRGTDSIYLRSDSATGTVIESFDAATSNCLSISGTTLTINPTNDLATNTHYYLTFASGTTKDLAGNNYAGTTSYDFTTAGDTKAPTISSFTPNDGISGVDTGSNIVVTFNEAIQRGTGTIYLRSGSATGTVVESYLATNSSNLSISGSTLTINPTNNLANNTHYFVTFASGTIKDLAGNSYAGTSSYDFTTATSSNSVYISSGGITLHLNYDAPAMAAPSSFRTQIEQAALMIANAISDPITVNLSINISGSGGGAYAGPTGVGASYSSVRSFLTTNATSGDTEFQYLPNTSSIQGQSNVVVWSAQEKLFGLLAADASATDGSVHFSSDISSNAIIGVALHEITHAMGRVPYGATPDIFDFSRYTNASTRLFTGGSSASPAYFSIDGGTTKLADYGLNSDPSDFLNSGMQGSTDPFNEFYTPGSTSQALSSVDLKQMVALGYHLTANSAATAPLITNNLSLVSQNVSTASLGGHVYAIPVNASPAQGITIQTISNYNKGAVSTGDQLYFDCDLSLCSVAGVQTNSDLTINSQTGVVNFASGSAIKLQDAVSKILTYFQATQDRDGEIAFFKADGDPDFDLFISDGKAGLTETDTVVKLVGVNSISAIDLTDGHLTILA